MKEIKTLQLKEIKIDGEVCNYRLPTMKEQANFSKKQKSIVDDFDNIDLMVELLVGLGLPKEKVELFALEDIKVVMALILPTEEKKS